MLPEFKFVRKSALKADTLVLTVREGGKLSVDGQKVDRDYGGLAGHYLKDNKKFTGKQGQVAVLATGPGSRAARLVLLGLGNPAKLNAFAAEETGGKLYAALSAAGCVNVTVAADDLKGGKSLPGAEAAAHLAAGFLLRSYRFEKYKSKAKRDEDQPSLRNVEVVTGAALSAEKIFRAQKAGVQGVFFARDLMNEPPNILYPEVFAKRVKDELVPLGVSVEIFDEKKLEKLGFKAHLAVGQGSIRPPRAVVMRWPGVKQGVKKASSKPLAFVGKGITFDTGGINIKPSEGMQDMKFDMGGAAAVVGLMRTLAGRKAKADVVGIIGIAENMPSHMSYRPSDIIGSLAGKSIEVLNTDAEGRLVLADALTYVQRTYKPRFVIDLATLTGAIMVALGHEYAGTFVNDETLWKQLDAAGRHTGERMWRMPLDGAFKKSMEGTISDLRNLSSMGRNGGACSAAGFLEHFIESGTPWAHIDIAGTAWVHADRATSPKPATGFGVRSLDRLVANHYEK